MYRFLSRTASLTFFAALTFNVAHAQPADIDQGQSVFDKPRPDYDPNGVRLGSFVVKPEIGLFEQYRTNIFKTDQNEEEDFITFVSPELTIESDWSRHYLEFRSSADFAFLADNSNENFEDFNFGASTRLDVMRETFIVADIDYDILHEDRGSPDDANGVERTEYDVLSGLLGINKGFNRFTFRLDGVVEKFDYDDVVVSGGGVNNQDDRDRLDTTGTFRASYEIQPGYEAFTQLSYGTREYDDSVDDLGLNRDSDGYDILVGSAVAITGKVRGEAYIGFQERDYDDAALAEIDNVAFGAEILWNASELTSLEFAINRGIEETTLNNASGYTDTSYGVLLEHKLMRNILVDAGVSYSQHEYEGGTLNRDDDLFSFGVGGTYLFNRNVSFTAGYNYDERDSNQANSDFKDHYFTLGAKLAF